MSEQPRVVVDGVRSEQPTSPRRPSSWLLTGVTLAVGLGLGITILLTDVGGETPELDPGVISPPVIGDVPQITDSGVGEAIEGFSGTIVAVSDGGQTGRSALYWPSGSGLKVTDSNSGSNPLLDRSGLLIASSTEVPGLDGVVLSVGRIGAEQPIAYGATSYLWHDSQAGHLSYTRVVEGRWELWRVFSDLQPEMVTAGLVENGWVAAWGDWGWAIQTPNSEVMFLTPSGELKTIYPGTAFASDGNGWIVVANDQLELVSAGGGVAGLDASLTTVGVLHTAAVSPDGERLALAGSEGLLVVPISGEGVTLEFDIPTSHSIAWTADGHFVLAPGDSGLTILDVRSGVRQTFLSQFAIADVRVTGG